MAIFKAIAYFAPRVIGFHQPTATVPTNAYVFIADDNYSFVEARVRYSAAGGTSATVDVYKVPSGTALVSGTTVLTAPQALTGAADTSYVASPASPATQFVKGDAVAIVFAGTLTGLTGLDVQIIMKPTSHIANRVR